MERAKSETTRALREVGSSAGAIGLQRRIYDMVWYEMRYDGIRYDTTLISPPPPNQASVWPPEVREFSDFGSSLCTLRLALLLLQRLFG